MIAVLDYDAGNTRSVLKAVKYLGYDAVMTRDPEEIRRSRHVILPGVGAFGDAMDHLKRYGLDREIRTVVEAGTPFLGICLGLQVLYEESEEDPGVPGLSLLPGKIHRFPPDMGLKVPHMGWNSLELKGKGRLFKGVEEGAFVYFVHSYYLKSREASDVRATCRYGLDFDASVERGNLFACQFHPEKSGEVGLYILKNFLEV